MRRSRCQAKGSRRGYTPPIQDCFTRLAGNECRGGSRELRPFRRGRGGEEHRHQAEQAMAWHEAYKPRGREMSLWREFGAHLGLDMLYNTRKRQHVSAPATIWSYVSAYRSAGGHMDLRFCIPERRGRGGRGQCGCGSSLAHIEVSAAAGPSSDLVDPGAGNTHV